MKNIHKFNKIQINKKNIKKNELLKNVFTKCKYNIT